MSEHRSGLELVNQPVFPLLPTPTSVPDAHEVNPDDTKRVWRLEWGSRCSTAPPGDPAASTRRADHLVPRIWRTRGVSLSGRFGDIRCKSVTGKARACSVDGGRYRTSSRLSRRRRNRAVRFSYERVQQLGETGFNRRPCPRQERPLLRTT